MAMERGGISRDDQRSDTIVDTRKNKHVPQNMGKKQQPKELINVYYGIQLGVGFDILSVNFFYIYTYCFCFGVSTKIVHRVCEFHNFGLLSFAADAWGYFTTLKPYQLWPNRKSVLIYIYKNSRTKNVLLWIISHIFGNKLIQQLFKVTPIVVGCGKKRKMKCIMWKSYKKCIHICIYITVQGWAFKTGLFIIFISNTYFLYIYECTTYLKPVVKRSPEIVYSFEHSSYANLIFYLTHFIVNFKHELSSLSYYLRYAATLMSGSGGTHFYLYIVTCMIVCIYILCPVFKRLQFTNVNIMYKQYNIWVNNLSIKKSLYIKNHLSRR